MYHVSRHPRRDTRIRKKYKFKNGFFVEIGHHMAWDCLFIEVFHEPSGKHKHYAKQTETLRELFRKIRWDMAVMENPAVETVGKRVSGQKDFNEFLQEYLGHFGPFIMVPKNNIFIQNISPNTIWTGAQLVVPFDSESKKKEKKSLWKRIKGVFK